MRHLPWAFLILANASSAHAEEAQSVTARLEWTREPNGGACLDGPAVARAVKARWGRRVFVEGERADIVLKARIGPRGPHAWAARLEMRRADGSSLGSREIVTAASECSVLDDSVVLAVGLMLDVTRKRLEDERESSRTTPPATQASFDGPPITIPADTVAPRERVRFEFRLGGEAALGLLPGPAVAARGSVAFDVPRFWRIFAAASLWAKDQERTGTQGARFSMWTVELGPCPLGLRRLGWAFHGCIVQRLGQVRAAGFGFDENAVETEPFFSVGARAIGSWLFAEPFGFGADLGMEAPLLRYRFAYHGTDGSSPTTYRLPPIAASVALGLVARF